MVRHCYALLAALCFAPGSVQAEEPRVYPAHVLSKFGVPPAIPSDAVSPGVEAALERVLEIAVDQARWRTEKTEAFDVIAQSGDPRLVWALADMLRFAWRPEFRQALTDGAASLLKSSFDGPSKRESILNAMIAWDMPAYPGYLAHKRRVFTNYVPGWEAIFTEGDIDWHLVDWGGVEIDARPYGQTDEVCHCIPAADNPPVSLAEEATWLENGDVVFGVVVNGEARAYPRRIMEVREMVNDTLGGRDLAIPYCTLCGAAQAFFTDALPRDVKRPILRTSGLLIRSNKVMYDVETGSVFDTFRGRAVTGPLAEIGLAFEQTTVITSDWGAWRATYPETTVLMEELALGRDFNLRETRDADGPIFPVGDVDPRLPVHEDVVGVMTATGTPVAFPRARAVAALSAGEDVWFEDVSLVLEAGGLAAEGTERPVESFQSFWFAWSQFHPTTEVWGE